MTNVVSGETSKLVSFANGTTSDLPLIGDMVIYAKSEERPWGHVSIVTAVDQSGVYTGEQNMRNVPVWTDNYTKKLELVN